MVAPPKEMMSLIKNEQKAPNNQLNDEKKKKQEERCKWYNNAPICKHCGKKHLAKAEDKCWELEKNKDSRPSNWKSAKKHLIVHGAHTRIRAKATRTSDIELNKHDSHLPCYHKLLGPIP
jgi:hypothetical protein